MPMKPLLVAGLVSLGLLQARVGHAATELEQRADTIAEDDLPSGDTLAEQLTRFLRERDENGPDDDARGGP